MGEGKALSIPALIQKNNQINNKICFSIKKKVVGSLSLNTSRVIR
jgi:hypothetical protein